MWKLGQRSHNSFSGKIVSNFWYFLQFYSVLLKIIGEQQPVQRTNQGRTPIICSLWVPIHLSFNSRQGPPLSVSRHVHITTIGQGQTYSAIGLPFKGMLHSHIQFKNVTRTKVSKCREGSREAVMREGPRKRGSGGEGCVADQKPFLDLKKEIRGIPRENQSLEPGELGIKYT